MKGKHPSVRYNRSASLNTAQLWYGLLGLFIALLVGSCNDPTAVGSELLDEDQANVGFTDSIPLTSRTVTSDSLIVFFPNPESQLRTYLFANYVDPLFGRFEVQPYFQLLPEALNPEFENAVFDSIVLVLIPDSSGYYGPLDQPIQLNVERVIEPIPTGEVLTAERSFATDLMPLGQKRFSPGFDSLTVFDFNSSDVDTISFVHLRVPLSQAFGEELLRLDSSIYPNDSLFLDALKGLKLVPQGTTSGSIGFDLFDPRTGIYLYYTDMEDTTARQFQFRIFNSTTKAVEMRTDPSGSPLQVFLDQPELGDSIAFLRGGSGVDFELTIDSLENIGNVAINNARLTLRVEEQSPGDDPLHYPPAEQITILYPDEEGNLILIEDFLIANALDFDPGGAYEAGGGDEPGTYSVSITGHLQDVLSGGLSNKLIIRVDPKPQRANRSVIYGAGHNQYAAQLEIIYTEL